MATLPTDYTDATTPTGALTELPATTTRGINAINAEINAKTPLGNVGVLQPVRVTGENAQTYTIASGTVTQIAGTTVDGVSVAVGDRVGVVGAPASTGAGGFQTNNPGNGIYVVTGNTTNITVVRATDMTGGVNPSGMSFVTREGSWANYTIYWDRGAGIGTFTWGTTALSYSGYGRFHGNLLTGQMSSTTVAQTLINKTMDGASNTFTNIPATAVVGLTSGNTSQQSQLVVAGTAYYVTGSSLTVPTNLAVGSRFRWTITLVKTAAGTGTFNIRIYRGTNGSTADTADVTQAVTAAATAVADALTVDVEIVVTATGATGSYYWAIVPANRVSATTGFATSSAFSGTVSSVALNTASLKFGLSFINVTGTPTITVPMVRANGYV